MDGWRGRVFKEFVANAENDFSRLTSAVVTRAEADLTSACTSLIGANTVVYSRQLCAGVWDTSKQMLQHIHLTTWS
ncbi:hypothetical protein chiPu_0001963 [Chiloscyllium punctatum]|uniref:Uncharacterized protein n=1 Tax=Chiloscyllium punctatum TaxID=137246 RepID=A0A401RZJ3_CHIPU|nr:hypothetical protein [Chiloscyllium punctatum]